MKQEHREFVKKLRAARKLLQKGWTQGAFARDRFGSHVHRDSPRAVCWCLMGAMKAAGFDCWLWTGRTSIVQWNDSRSRTKEQAIACINNSIAALGAV